MSQQQSARTQITCEAGVLLIEAALSLVLLLLLLLGVGVAGSQFLYNYSLQSQAVTLAAKEASSAEISRVCNASGACVSQYAQSRAKSYLASFGYNPDSFLVSVRPVTLETVGLSDPWNRAIRVSIYPKKSQYAALYGLLPRTCSYAVFKMQSSTGAATTLFARQPPVEPEAILASSECN